MDRGMDLPIKFACIFHSFPLVCECAYACVGGGGLGLLLWVRSKDLKCQADLSKVQLSDIWTSTEGCRSGYIWSHCAQVVLRLLTALQHTGLLMLDPPKRRDRQLGLALQEFSPSRF